LRLCKNQNFRNARISRYRVLMKFSIPILLVLLVGGWLLIEPLSNEVTVYKMFCTKGRVQGECHSEEQTANPTTYKVFVEQQTVVYWIGGASPVRFPFCAVRDIRNWSCKYETGNELPAHEYIMNDGEFHETGFTPMVEDIFYNVSRWHWWRVWFAQKLK
jgi:hypothetical protein